MQCTARKDVPAASCAVRLRVMQLTDSLALGGTERVAVNLANGLAERNMDSHLCATRGGGPLEKIVDQRVKSLSLNRSSRFDLRAMKALIQYNRSNQIQILHAHSSSLLVANIASRFRPFPKVIWHDHFGRFEVERRSLWLFRLLGRRAAGVISVTQALANWSVRDLRLDTHRVWYLPNFPASVVVSELLDELPGIAGQRIVCVANLRPEKDHLTLINAMQQVCSRHPQAVLFLLGSESNQAQVAAVRSRIESLGLEGQIKLLGSCSNVAAYLQRCDIGVLSSVSEGLPLSLLEYGLHGLPVVATDVGQCREVLDNGRFGKLVPSRSPDKLAEALNDYLDRPDYRRAQANAYKLRVLSEYSAESYFERLSAIYRSAVGHHS